MAEDSNTRHPANVVIEAFKAKYAAELDTGALKSSGFPKVWREIDGDYYVTAWVRVRRSDIREAESGTEDLPLKEWSVIVGGYYRGIVSATTESFARAIAERVYRHPEEVRLYVIERT